MVTSDSREPGATMDVRPKTRRRPGRQRGVVVRRSRPTIRGKAAPLALALAVAVLALGAAGCGSSKSTGGASNNAAATTAPTGSASGGNVDIKNIAFNPSQLSVKAGGTVTWTFDDSGTSHTVTADDGSFDSGQHSSGTFSHTFATPGTFTYHCNIHSTMKATITVT